MFKTNRKTVYSVDPLILNRWSSRAFSQEPVTQEELMSLFDAARWAQSCYNNQPWRFIYARKNSPSWTTFFDLMVPANQAWAKNAAVLVLVISKKTFSYNGKPSRTHSFDTGAAAQNMALQGARMDIVVHGMEGFDYDRARTALAIPDDYQVEALFAIGKYGNKEELPADLAAKEVPSGRNPLDHFVFEGKFLEK